MPLEVTYLNQRLELFDGVFGEMRRRELDAVSRLYNRHIGPIGALHLERPEPIDFGMYTGSSSHSPVNLLVPDLTVRPMDAAAMAIPGGGKGLGLAQPLTSALGELAERLLAVLHFQAVVDQLEFATYEMLSREGRRALGPEDLQLFAPEQLARPGFGYVPFRHDTPLRWITGTDLLSGEPVLVPAQLVLLYYRRQPGEAPIGYPTSGGLAFHTDRQRAILHGLYEYIERDAINVRWYCRLAPPRVSLDLAAFIAARWHPAHVRFSSPNLAPITVYLNTLDVPIPVFTAVSLDTHRRTHGFVGAGGAWADRDRALVQTLFELGQTRGVLTSCASAEGQIHADSSTGEMRQFLDGALYFGHEENRERLDWYLSEGGSIEWDAIPGLGSSADTGWLRAAGLAPVVIDLDGACWPGVHVVRVIVPQLTAACVAAHPYLGHSRYYTMPIRQGLTSRPLTFDDLNPDPIPFP